MDPSRWTQVADEQVFEEPRVSGVALSQRAFREIYEREFDFVWRNLARLGVPVGDLEDRAQEVFIIAHRKIDAFVERGHGPRAWLFQIALRVASNARREKRRRPATPDLDALALVRSEDDPSRDAETRQAQDLLDAVLEQMDFDRRAVLILHEIEEMTAGEIAAVLEIPVNTAYSRLRAARREFEMLLARRRHQGGWSR